MYENIVFGIRIFGVISVLANIIVLFTVQFKSAQYEKLKAWTEKSIWREIIMYMLSYGWMCVFIADMAGIF